MTLMIDAPRLAKAVYETNQEAFGLEGEWTALPLENQDQYLEYAEKILGKLMFEHGDEDAHHT